MQNKLLFVFVFMLLCTGVRAEDVAPVDEVAADVVAEDVITVDEYEPTGSLFQLIADLEQDKIVLQLEKEKAQLQVEMDRLAAEQVRIRNEMDAISGAGSAQNEALELERKRLELEKEKLEAQRKNMNEPAAATQTKRTVSATSGADSEPSEIAEKYSLIEIVGSGRQLFATVEEVSNGQRKRISVGKMLDDYHVDSVSLDDGVILSKDGETAVLGVRTME